MDVGPVFLKRKQTSLEASNPVNRNTFHAIIMRQIHKVKAKHILLMSISLVHCSGEEKYSTVSVAEVIKSGGRL